MQDDDPLRGDVAEYPASGWTRVCDWLGARRPLDLILAACTIIAAVATIAR